MRWLGVCWIVCGVFGVIVVVTVVVAVVLTVIFTVLLTVVVRGTISKLQSEDFDAGNLQFWNVDLECRRIGEVSVRWWSRKKTPKSDGQATTGWQDDGNDCRSR